MRPLKFSGRAPQVATPERFSEETLRTGILALLAPGNVASWLTIHEAYGSMDRKNLFAPAIGYAENGFPVTHWCSQVMNDHVGRLQTFPSSAAIILDGDGQCPRAGARLFMPQLAASFRTLARNGEDSFYRGELAEKLIDGVSNLDGLLTAADLADYRAEWVEPINTEYRDYEIFTHPPNSSAFQVLETPNLMEGFAPDERVDQDPQKPHLFMEAAKLCVTDRIQYADDPDCVQIPLRGLPSKDYAAEQCGGIDAARAATVRGEHYVCVTPDGALVPGDSKAFDGGMTTHFAVADRDGNVVTVTQTLGGGFGSAVGDTSIFLNNIGN